MRKKDKPKYYLLGVVAVSLVFTIVILGGSSGSGNSLYLNTVPLSFNEQFRDINCQAFNEILIDGRLVDSGEDGFQPLVDSTTLNLQDGSRDVKIITIQLAMECKGDFIKDSSSTIVSGNFKMLLCGGSSPRICIASDDRSFEILNGVASSTQQFATVPIEPQVVPKDNEKFIVWKGNISASFLESLFPEGKSVVLTSKMFPVFTFTFNHPSGIIIAKQDSFAVNDVVYAQYNGLANVAPPPVDTDGDGIVDGQDSCTGQPEDFNGFEDEDGCPDAFKLLDDDNDGITNINDNCPFIAGVQSNLGCPEDVVVDPDTSGDTVNNNVEDDDNDGDGVFNQNDICPNTSSGAIVDASGCVLITDTIVVAPIITGTDDDGNQIPLEQDTDNPFANIPDLINPNPISSIDHVDPFTTGNSVEPSLISGIDNSTLLIVGVVIGIIAVVGIIVKGRMK